MGVEARGVAAGLVLGGAGLAGPWALAAEISATSRKNISRENSMALWRSRRREEISSCRRASGILAPQVVDLLLVEVSLLQRVGRIPQAVASSSVSGILRSPMNQCLPYTPDLTRRKIPSGS